MDAPVIGQDALDLDRARDRRDGAAKRDEEAVTRMVDLLSV